MTDQDHPEPAFVPGDAVLIRATGEICRIASLVPMIARDGTPTGGAIVGWYYAVAEPVWALYPARALVALTDEAVNQRRIAAAVGRVARREGLAT